MYNYKNRAFLLKSHLKSVLGSTQLQSISLHGKTWQWLEAGDPSAAETVVILHGLSMSKNHWRTTLAVLSSNYRVIVPDVPGFKIGFEVKDIGSGFEGIAKELAEFLTVVVGRPTHIVGHSMAATLALGLSMRMVVPVKSISLVSLADANVTQGLSIELQFKRMSDFILNATEQQYLNYVTAMFHIPPPAIKMMAKASWDSLVENREQVVELFTAMESEFSLVKRFGNALDIPMLILNGKQDLWYDLTLQSRFFQNQRVTRVELDECRHLPFIERPMEFCNALGQFIAAASGEVAKVPEELV